MKKLFTLTTLLVLAMTVNAQETYRKSWDFTKWSATTVANLKADAAASSLEGWSDIEKKVDAGEGKTAPEATAEKCYWYTGAEGGNAKANGEEIEELKGLNINATYAGNRSLAIAIDYSSTSLGSYAGPSYLWLGGGGKSVVCFTMKAKVGEQIVMEVESHKPSDARGVELYVGSITAANKIGGSFKPTTKDTHTWAEGWELPAGQTADENGLVDVIVYNTSGCHIYNITIGEGDTPQTEEAKNVAYIHNGGLDEDFAYVMLSGDNRFNVIAIDVATAPTYTSLTEGEYDVAVFAPSVTAESAAVVKALIAYFPVVNLNANLYSAWGYGSAAPFEETKLTKTAGNAYADAIFEGIESATYDGNITAVSLGDYFANDEILAFAGPATAIHAHNPGRNAYYYVPSVNMSEVIYGSLIPNVVLAAAKTKKTVTAAGTPAISFTQGDGVSTVTITAANSSAIYYTTDGSDPKTAGTAYTEPFDLTADATVKAYAAGADGYLDSEVSEKQVTIATMTATPTASISRETGKSTVTLSTETPNADIYFNFTKSNVVDNSQKYDAENPIVVEEPTTVYFFAQAEGTLASEIGEQFIGVDGFDKNNIRWDVMAHMGGESAEWATAGENIDGRSSKVNYLFFKSSKSTAEVTEKLVVKNASGKWQATTLGQCIVWQNDGIIQKVGAAGRNPETVYDMMNVNATDGPTNMFLNFKSAASGDEPTGTIETTTKYQAPFDVVVFLCNGNKNATVEPDVDVEVSSDGESWTKVGDLNATVGRFIKRTRLSYDGTDEVYVRVAHKGGSSEGQVLDIYLLNNGEESKKYDDIVTGISTVESKQSVAADGIYNINGVRMQQLQRGLNIVKTADGQVKKLMVK